MISRYKAVLIVLKPFSSDWMQLMLRDKCCITQGRILLKVQNWEYKYKVQIQDFPHGERQPQMGAAWMSYLSTMLTPHRTLLRAMVQKEKFLTLTSSILKLTRMHSSRMCTVRCSGHLSYHPPTPAMHAPCHTHPPLPCMPSATHVPCHTCPPATHSPCHACSPPPPVNRITDACENITLPQLRCEREWWWMNLPVILNQECCWVMSRSE